MAELADAKVRVALYGSAEVVKSLAAFCRTTQHLGSPEAKQSFVTLALAMRADAEISVTDLTTIFFEG